MHTTSMLDSIKIVLNKTMTQHFFTTLVLSFIFILPSFTGTMSGVSPNVYKIALSLGVITLSFFMFFYIQKKMGEVEIPQQPLFFLLFLSTIVALISSLMYGHVPTSFVDLFSTHFFSGATIMAVSLFVFLAISTYLFKQEEDQLSLLYTVLYSSGAVVVLYICNTFILRFFSTHTLFSEHYSVIGTWQDSVFFWGLITIILVSITQTLRQSVALQVYVYILLCSAFYFLLLSHNALVSILVLLSVSLSIFYKLFIKTQQLNSKVIRSKGSITILPVIVFLFLAISIFNSTVLHAVPWYEKHTPVDAKPSLSATFFIALETWKEGPMQALFGSGPDTFSKQWSLHKPLEVRFTSMSDVDFSTGSGRLPTEWVTTGLLKLLIDSLFFGVFMWYGLVSLFFRQKYTISLTHALLFVPTFYLWCILFFFNPGITLVLLTYVFTGAFISSCVYRNKEKSVLHIQTGRENVKTNILLFIGVVLLFSFLSFSFYTSFKKARAESHFSQGVMVFDTTQDATLAEPYIIRALNIYENDLYYRFFSNTQRFYLQDVLVRMQTSPAEEHREDFETTFEKTLQSAQKAVTLNPNNYLNWIVLARAYSIKTRLEEPVFVGEAREAYKKAFLLNPRNPVILFEEAQVLFRVNADGELREAHRLLEKALKLRHDFTEAETLLKKVEVRLNTSE